MKRKSISLFPSVIDAFFCKIYGFEVGDICNSALNLKDKWNQILKRGASDWGAVLVGGSPGEEQTLLGEDPIGGCPGWGLTQVSVDPVEGGPDWG